MHYQAQDELSSIIILLVLCISCGHVVRTPEIQQHKTAVSNDSVIGSHESATRDPITLCNRIPEIKIYPFKGDKGDDATYDAFMEAGETVIPCLIEKVGDKTKMRDPRQEPGYPDIEIRVGDIAYFLLIDISKLGFTTLLPPEVQGKFKDVGVYAYFKYVEKSENRKKLQSNLYQWYRQKYGKDALKR